MREIKGRNKNQTPTFIDYDDDGSILKLWQFNPVHFSATIVEVDSSRIIILIILIKEKILMKCDFNEDDLMRSGRLREVLM